MMYAGDEEYSDDISSGPPPELEGEPDPLDLEPEHEGCPCAACGRTIDDEDEGTSSPSGSMHTWCATTHEREHPEDW